MAETRSVVFNPACGCVGIIEQHGGALSLIFFPVKALLALARELLVYGAFSGEDAAFELLALLTQISQAALELAAGLLKLASKFSTIFSKLRVDLGEVMLRLIERLTKVVALTIETGEFVLMSSLETLSSALIILDLSR